ncbi:MAG: helix-turn-helix transcriptional regulator [Piscirickettsiaceae bacterium]|nr:helix-turn-helix transcriptional regulator [Piscirickettsiaceae bacterium]
MKIYIKNMVCDRCCLVVGNVLKNIGLRYASIDLGEIDFADYHGAKLPDNVETLLSNDLEDVGFSILSDKKSKLIEDIKKSCLDYIQHIEELDKKVLSDHISNAIALEYNYLSNLFSVVEGITIEQYFIRLRVEKVKELLIYGEMALGEIAFQLGYSSVAHLSGQFKKVSGLTPSYFRSLKNLKLRHSLDKL